MKSGRRGPNLFEVMSKTPQARNARAAGTWSNWLKRRGNAKPARAVALTEQEALLELAAQRAPATPVRESAPAVPNEVLQAGASEARSTATRSLGRWVDASGGRLKLSLSTPICVAVIGILCVVLLGAYSLGRNGAGKPTKLPSVAALTRPSTDGNKTGTSDSAASPPSTGAKLMENPDLSELLKKPPARTEPITVNRPPVSKQEPAAAGKLPEDLNYLQIESFRITRERNGEQLAQDLAEVRGFLAEHGIRTFARKRSNGYSLFAEQGFQPGRDKAAERDAFRRRIEELGRLYRGSGGLYKFKGCLFVNYAMTKAGDPV